MTFAPFWPAGRVASRLAGLFLGALAALACGPAATQPLVPIETARLDTVWQLPQRSAPAQVMARNESRLAAEVGGTVTRWTADVGASVTRGALLVQIDPQDYELAVQRAEAGLQAAQARLRLGEAQLARARELVTQGFFSQEALAQRETEVALQRADLAAAESQLASARRQLARTSIRAPFAGTVVQRMAQLGEAVAPGAPLFVLAETGAAEVQASVTPADIGGLRRASAVHFQPQGQDRRHALKLLRVTGTVQAGSRTQTVRLGFEGPAALPPGTSGLLWWEDPTPHVPASLVVKRGNRLGVFVREGRTARFVALPDAQEGRAVPIALPGETLIVVRGQAALNDGQSID
ncbi:efflux RND transporter periplasmic adaptor subunit [Tepidicella xavieri]|uniref:RND family efflux transporter MFP subunit n=1 Tax=Tepidicella xavieri TaxID=360241 RepID=A0A4R6UJV4_9BURK|nr:efflux RND transporter periplasmic adaptor subunit [Tepidicella xavieri]TDQ45365.1 RND family efflux transporter MFP subunit [Tepidicella xavieri]